MKSVIIIFRKNDNILKVLFFLCGTISGALGGCWFGKLPIFPPWPRGNAAPRLQISKSPAKNTWGYSNIQIYSSTSMKRRSRAPNLSNIWVLKLQITWKKTWDTCVNNTWKQRFVFTGNNRRIDSPDPLHCHTDFAVCTLWRGSKYPNISRNIKLLVKKNLWRI